MSRIRTLAVKTFVDFVNHRFGPESMNTLLSGLSPKDRMLFDQRRSSGEWIDYGHYLRFITAADKLLGLGDRRIVESAVRYSLRTLFRTTFQTFHTVITPKVVLMHAHDYWRWWFESGVLKPEMVDTGHFRLTLSQFPNIPPLHEFHLTPSFDEILHLSGAKITTTRHTSCQRKGDAACVWDMHWER